MEPLPACPLKGIHIMLLYILTALVLLAAIVGLIRITVWLKKDKASPPWTFVKWVRSKIKWPWFNRSGAEKSTGNLYSPDLRFNPITWNLVFRPLSSLAAGLLAAGTVKLIIWGMFQFGYLPIDPVSLRIVIAITVLVALGVAMPETAETDTDGNVTVGETVPETDYGAVITFMGMVLPFIRTSGKYRWLGKRISLDRSRKAFVGVTDPSSPDLLSSPLAKGFVPLGDITFQVWDSPDASDNKEKRTKIVRPAKNRASVTGSLTLVGDFPKPRLWLKASDPALDVGDRARQEYQELIETLVDSDVASVQPMLESYLAGKMIYTAFLTDTSEKELRRHKPGAMIRDRSGLVMYRIVEKEEDLTTVLADFRKTLVEKADPHMLKAITHKKHGEAETDLAITILKVSGPLHEVTSERGFHLKRVTFGDVLLSQPVTDAAAQASAEADERQAQLASAQTNRDAREILRPTPDELANREIYELTTVLAAAADSKNGNIRVVMVPGGTSLTKGMVAAGQQIGSAT
jgi:hypothetical protein